MDIIQEIEKEIAKSKLSGLNKAIVYTILSRAKSSVEDEKKGEVVLDKLTMITCEADEDYGYSVSARTEEDWTDLDGKNGQLIFRPDTGEDKGGK